jgi:hypothetical protein
VGGLAGADEVAGADEEQALIRIDRIIAREITMLIR